MHGQFALFVYKLRLLARSFSFYGVDHASLEGEFCV